MKFSRVALYVIFLLGVHVSSAQETFRFMFYNVLNYPNLAPADRIDDLEFILQDIQPDVLMICELNNEQGADNILNVLQTLKPQFARANFVTNTSDNSSGDQNDLQNMIFYDSSKFILNAQTEVTTDLRDFNHYTMQLNTVDQAVNPIIFHAIVCHLKAGSGVDNQDRRFNMVNQLTGYLNGFSADDLVILGGDLNLYTSLEPAFQELIEPTNTITFADPVNRIGTWHENLAFLDVFTQSTRDEMPDGGSGGGFDDRFDFILTSESVLTDPNLEYIPGSYKAYGNNANNDCYNEEIINSGCAGQEYDLATRSALYDMSDHLPVILDLQSTATLLDIPEASQDASFVIEGGNVIDQRLILTAAESAHKKDISIFNVYGQLIGRYYFQGQSRLEIDISHWSSGIYYIVFPKAYQKPMKFIKK